MQFLEGPNHTLKICYEVRKERLGREEEEAQLSARLEPTTSRVFFSWGMYWCLFVALVTHFWEDWHFCHEAGRALKRSWCRAKVKKREIDWVWHLENRIGISELNLSLELALPCAPFCFVKTRWTFWRWNFVSSYKKWLIGRTRVWKPDALSTCEITDASTDLVLSVCKLKPKMDWVFKTDPSLKPA